LQQGITSASVLRNASPAVLSQLALLEKRADGQDCVLASTGALIAYSGVKTGRSPLDKRIVQEETSQSDVWWGKVNIPLSPQTFEANTQRALAFLNQQPQLFVVDGFAGWDTTQRIKVRIICARPYHALFMHNMLIRPTPAELETFGEPDWVIYNAGEQQADATLPGLSSGTSVSLNFKAQTMVILGTEYAGCMKKGVFTILNYSLPKKDILSMHCSANQALATTEGQDGDVALFFGLSGTGKTTLSADPDRQLIGDDEHGWGENGVFNIEGGCYAKTVKLRQSSEPEIWDAIRFGSVLENVIYHPDTHVVDYDDIRITENTRVSYPIEYIENAKIPCEGGHPRNIIFLTCDAYGVLPPISQLTPEQAMYHFISGYTAKVAGTEVGVIEPEATFSACFGAAFMVWHPMKYAQLLADKIERHQAKVWLVNTGWSGGPYGVGKRFSLAYTRTLITAALSGALNGVDYVTDPIFGVKVPTTCPPQHGVSVPDAILGPKNTWADANAYDETARKLAGLFHANFEQFTDGVSPAVLAAGPKQA
jgi:phosphoenolpyruvate carboxykinase (ATP)